MPDPTPLSPLAGIEQNQRGQADTMRFNAEVRWEGRPAEEWLGYAAEYDRRADYLAGLGKVLEECELTYRAWYVASVMAGCSPRDDAACEATFNDWKRAAEQLGRFLTSPRETVGKEKE